MLAPNQSTVINSTAQTCLFSHNVIPDSQVFEVSPLKGSSYKGSDFIQKLLCSLQKQNLESSKLVGTVTDVNHSEASYEDNKSTSQLKLVAHNAVMNLSLNSKKVIPYISYVSS